MQEMDIDKDGQVLIFLIFLCQDNVTFLLHIVIMKIHFKTGLPPILLDSPPNSWLRTQKVSSWPCRAHSVIFQKKIPIWHQTLRKIMIYALLSLNFLGAINELFLPIFLARKVDLANFSAVIIKLGISQVTREEFVKAFLRWTEDDTHYTIIIFFTTKAIINIAIIINNVLKSPFSDRRVLPLYLSTRWKHKYLFLDEMRISCRWSWEMQIIKWMKM